MVDRLVADGYPTDREGARWGLCLGALVCVGGCRGDSELLGKFGGDWDIGGGVMLSFADGGSASYLTEANHPQTSESEVSITTKDHAQYEVKIDTPFMACTLVARINNEKELVLDGPVSSDGTPSVADSLARWQHCNFSLEGFRGEANVRGTVRPSPGGAITIVMQVLPLGSPPTVGMTEGSAAMAHFVGNRNRTIVKH